MNCDRISRSYQWFEFAAFGRRLERYREKFVPQLTDVHRALLLGDGDGRFLTAFALANTTVEIDCVEQSGKMLEQLNNRVRRKAVPSPERIRLHRANALTFDFEVGQYDLISTHFFFDCFSTADVVQLCCRIAPACTETARWIVSEFQVPSHGWRKWHARLWLTVMYNFFRCTTGLRVSRLPAYAPALASAGFQRQQVHTTMAGLIASELWVR